MAFQIVKRLSRYGSRYATQGVLFGMILACASACALVQPAQINPPVTPTAAVLTVQPILLPTALPPSPFTPTPDSLAISAPISPTAPTLLEITPSPGITATQTTGWISDLIFQSKTDLIRWQPDSTEAQRISEQAIRYAASRDGSQIAVLQNRQITANAEQLFDLVIFHSWAGDPVTILPSTPKLDLLTVSPDGRWVNFLDPDQPDRILQSTTRQAVDPTYIGDCQRVSPEHCTVLIWSSDSRDLMWSDRQGLWVSHESQQASLVAAPVVETIDPQGEKSVIQVAFVPIRWSPAGRFALIDVIPSTSAVHWLAIVDTRSGQIVEVPGTFSHRSEEVVPYAVNWLSDGQLSVVARDSDQGQRFPVISIYKTMPTHDEMLVFQKDYPTFADSQLLQPSEHPGITYSPAWLSQTESQQISFGLIPSDLLLPVILINVDLKTGQVAFIRTYQNDLRDIRWSASRADAVLIGKHGQVFLSLADGSPVIDMRAIFDATEQDFTWLSTNN
jgi:hypothetical protein